jgi:hypothetical protein
MGVDLSMPYQVRLVSMAREKVCSFSHLPSFGMTLTKCFSSTQDLAWDTLNNGELLKVAEQAAFEIFLTTDKNIRYQQNLADRIIAIVVLGNSRWPVVRLYVNRVVAAIAGAKPGTYTEVEIPNQ